MNTILIYVFLFIVGFLVGVIRLKVKNQEYTNLVLVLGGILMAPFIYYAFVNPVGEFSFGSAVMGLILFGACLLWHWRYVSKYKN
jgi:hypothetical protein